MSSALVSAPLLAAAPGAAPACDGCHAQGGNHAARTAWDFLAVRLPHSEGPIGKADQITISQGLQVLDPKGEPTGRLAQDALARELRRAAATAKKARPVERKS